MNCPKCNHVEDKVIDSRANLAGNTIRRRRECLLCHYRFTTYEVMEAMPPATFEITLGSVEANLRVALEAIQKFNNGTNHPAITGRSNAVALERFFPDANNL